MTEQFGRLTVIGEAEDHIQARGKRYRRVVCRCSCGTEKLVLWQTLTSGYARSCGCLRMEMHLTRSATAARRREQHPGTYGSWVQMRSRCNDPGANGYARYGGRGIKVCSRWDSFDEFLADMGERPLGCSIDRIDCDGNYEPSNCRWATGAQQRNNTSRTRRLSFRGETHSIAEWSALTGLSQTCIRARLRRGWTVERSLT